MSLQKLFTILADQYSLKLNLGDKTYHRCINHARTTVCIQQTVRSSSRRRCETFVIRQNRQSSFDLCSTRQDGSISYDKSDIELCLELMRFHRRNEERGLTRIRGSESGLNRFDLSRMNRLLCTRRASQSRSSTVEWKLCSSPFRQNRVLFLLDSPPAMPR